MILSKKILQGLVFGDAPTTPSHRLEKLEGGHVLLILRILALLVMLGGIGWGVFQLFDKDTQEQGQKKAMEQYRSDHRNWEDYGKKRTEPEPQPPKTSVHPLRLGRCLVISIIGLVMVIALSGAAQIPATHIGVVENTWTGELYSLSPGTHIWPFTPYLTPLISKVTKYDLRRQIIEIGVSPVKDKGVEADSSSPGRPTVKFWARGWAYPNINKITTLHKRYGITYLDDWVERVWVSSLKAIQGEQEYDYVGKSREKFQDTVEQALQEQLMSENDDALVFVSQLAIVDFSWSPEIDSYLDSVSQKEFERQEMVQQIEVNKKAQEAALIQAQTSYSVTLLNASATKAQTETTSIGEATRIKNLADAEAYGIKAKYEAEATGITQVQRALAGSPEYLEYKRYERWDGKLPQYMFGGGTLPFIDVTPKVGQ